MGRQLINTPKHQDLIFDVGLHRGEDTDFYLRKGFRVVAFEANPELVDECRSRFKAFIDAGRLTIVEGAIVGPDEVAAGQSTITFYKNDTHAVLGTVRRYWADRNLVAHGTSSSTMEVSVVDFADALRKFGVPYYLKIDIEGCDIVCVRALADFKERPDYVSIESDKFALAKVRSELQQLAALGYESFMAVEQSSIPDTQIPPDPSREGEHVAMRFECGASGLFGRELPGSWLVQREIGRRYRWIFLSYYFAGDAGVVWRWNFRGSHRLRNAVLSLIRRLSGGTVPMWHDTHARHRSARVRQARINDVRRLL